MALFDRGERRRQQQRQTLIFLASFLLGAAILYIVVTPRSGGGSNEALSEQGQQGIDDSVATGTAADEEEQHHSQSTIGASGMSEEELWAWRNEVMRVTIPDAVNKIPRSLQEGVKNPCWASDPDEEGHPRGEEMFCLPYFYVLGNFQCGWADLYDKIMLHPHVVSRKPRGHIGTNFYFEKRPWNMFISSFGMDVPLIKDLPGDNIIGEASGGTLTFTWTHSERLHRAFDEEMRRCWNTCSETNKSDKEARSQCIETGCYRSSQEAHFAEWNSLGELTLPSLVYAVHGTREKIKLLAIVRNPADRLWASFIFYQHYSKKYGEGEVGFLKWFNEAVTEFERCANEYSVRHCALYFESLSRQNEQVFYHCDQLIKGMYSVFVEDWMEYFPNHQFLMIKFEDYIPSPQETLKSVYTFLDLPPFQEGKLEQVLSSSKSKLEKGDDPTIGEQMSYGTRHAVEAFYAPFNAKLAQQLNDERFLWNFSES